MNSRRLTSSMQAPLRLAAIITVMGDAAWPPVYCSPYRSAGGSTGGCDASSVETGSHPGAKDQTPIMRPIERILINQDALAEADARHRQRLVACLVAWRTGIHHSGSPFVGRLVRELCHRGPITSLGQTLIVLNRSRRPLRVNSVDFGSSDEGPLCPPIAVIERTFRDFAFGPDSDRLAVSTTCRLDLDGGSRRASRPHPTRARGRHLFFGPRVCTFVTLSEPAVCR
jgi:hypothetical protein